MRILLTGGCGFIGSHTALALLDAGHEPILLDNFSNCRRSLPNRLAAITGRPLTVIDADVRDIGRVRGALESERVDAVIHLAGLKAVAESVARPLTYYAHNVGGLLALLEAMQAAEVFSIVFSSSATVYGEADALPIDETCPVNPLNPYGRGKLICEDMLSDLARGDQPWHVSILRYFNPVGADPSGLIGEEPTGAPNNLMPLLIQAASGAMTPLPIYGTDYPTADGTAVRDYIHVADLAEGHVAALDALARGERFGVYNLGTGRGTSVRQLIQAFQMATGVDVPHVTSKRRPGDVAELYASTEKASRDLGWSAKRGLAEMCSDSWRFATRDGERA